jgi:hypothetical protein
VARVPTEDEISKRRDSQHGPNRSAARRLDLRNTKPQVQKFELLAQSKDPKRNLIPLLDLHGTQNRFGIADNDLPLEVFDHCSPCFSYGKRWLHLSAEAETQFLKDLRAQHSSRKSKGFQQDQCALVAPGLSWRRERWVALTFARLYVLHGFTCSTILRDRVHGVRRRTGSRTR